MICPPSPPIIIEITAALAKLGNNEKHITVNIDWGERVSDRHVRTRRKKGEASQLILSRVVCKKHHIYLIIELFTTFSEVLYW